MTTPATPATPPTDIAPHDSAPNSNGVPHAVRAASEWAWRGLLIAAGLALIGFVLTQVSVVVVPIVVAILLAAMLRPLMALLDRHMPRGLAVGLTLLAFLVVIAAALTLVGSQFSSGFSDLTSQVADGMTQVRDWVRTTFKISDTQFDEYFEKLSDQVGQSGNLGSTAATFGITAGHFVAGMFIALFTLIFFLLDGRGIWNWVVRLFPRSARAKIDSSGDIAWTQLSAFVRATAMVAAVDALGIGIGAAVLKVPFALAVGVLVFIGAFIPIVGAVLTGAVAVLLALVAHGPGVALIMLAVVIGVQQLESHVLQPLIMGHSVAVHPLAVILGIAAGSTLFGIVGALTAVPIMAVVNTVGKHLLSGESTAELEADIERGPEREPEPEPAS